ncbi:MAG TPA: ribonuclease HII [Candidatus Paceibacterota bacterium]|jgi:ribonuclease HII|nr:ribonuclease HII [Candidatus Paceibacterota bacterium]
MDKNIKYIVGIDEVGRGPIAGPVAVCAFVCPPDFFDNFRAKTDAKFPKLKDSKKLSRQNREKWFEYFKLLKNDGKCDFAVSLVSAEWIDKVGIVKCIQKALNKSIEKVTSPEILFARSSPARQSFGAGGDEGGRGARPSQKEFLASCHIFLDGGLKAPEQYLYQETIINGDETCEIISSASIIAKVTRDCIMFKYAEKFPNYGFENHVGYGTKAHYDAIKKHGQTPIHRKTFIH